VFFCRPWTQCLTGRGRGVPQRRCKEGKNPQDFSRIQSVKFGEKKPKRTVQVMRIPPLITNRLQGFVKVTTPTKSKRKAKGREDKRLEKSVYYEEGKGRARVVKALSCGRITTGPPKDQIKGSGKKSIALGSKPGRDACGAPQKKKKTGSERRKHRKNRQRRKGLYLAGEKA